MRDNSDGWLRRSVTRTGKRLAKAGLRNPLGASAIGLALETLIAIRNPFARGGFRRLRGKGHLKLHLGCGRDVRVGWVNVDLGLLPRPQDFEARGLFLPYDLRRPLPLDDDSCDIIYSSHFLEHLEYRHGLALLRECYRLLRPGGTLRLCLPNFRGLFQAYLSGDREYVSLINLADVLPDVDPRTATYVDYINYGVYQYGEHKCIYDEDKLKLLLTTIGFSSVLESTHQHELDPDHPVRRKYSFYLEAIK